MLFIVFKLDRKLTMSLDSYKELKQLSCCNIFKVKKINKLISEQKKCKPAGSMQEKNLFNDS